MQSYPVQITILEKIALPAIHQAYAKENLPLSCAKGEIGQVYISYDAQQPSGFCNGAWEGLARKVAMLAAGQNSPYTRQAGVAIHCCNDGLHPVVYKLERLEQG